MAPKFALKRVTPPSASTSSPSDEDEQLTDKEEEHQNQEKPKEPAEPEQESESEEEEEEEEEQQVNKDKPSALKPKPTTSSTKTTEPNSTSDFESGSDSDTNSGQTQPSPNAFDFNIKPIASKPMTGSLQPKKPTTKPVAKRPLETEKNANESKKKKTKVEEEEEKKPGGSIARLWSEDDEVVILKSMIKFQSKKGIDPSSDTVGFHEFIKKLLSVEVTKSWLMDKVRRLKEKYLINAGKGQKGEDPVFSKPHEHKCFGLSKKIWGGGGGKESKGVVGIGNGSGSGHGNGKSGSKTPRKNVKVEDSLALSKEKGKGVVTVEGVKGETKDVKVDKVEEFWSMFQCSKQSFLVTKMEDRVMNFLMANANVIGNVKATELEKKWKSLCLDEAALHLRRVELIQEHTKLVVDAMQASKD